MVTIFTLLKKKMPKKLFITLKAVRDIPKIISNYSYDFRRYVKHSSSIADGKKNKLEAQITAKYHVIEKGLSMPQPRLGFGKDKVKHLITLLERYKSSGYSMETTQIQAAIQTLIKYFEFNKNEKDERILSLKDKVYRNLIDFDKKKKQDGGTILIEKEEILSKSKGDFRELAYSRHSIRNFSEKPVDLNLIMAAIKIAQKTPSVCNRQASRVYVISDKEKLKEALALQNGNRGFGHLIDKILIITSDLNAFKGLIERNQSFIDGGMFSMSLLYSLHYHGLGAVALNWAVNKKKDKQLRQAIGINESENIIMMIGIGNLPDKLRVPISKRKDLKETTKII